MIESILFLGLVLMTILLGVRIVKKRRAGSKNKGRRARGPLDAWIEEILAVELARKLGEERDSVMKTLRDEPEPDTVTSVERVVRSVQVGYERLPEAGEAEVKLDLSFEDGASHVTRKRIPWQELPEDVRDEFARTGGAHVFRPWHFPWASPE